MKLNPKIVAMSGALAIGLLVSPVANAAYYPHRATLTLRDGTILHADIVREHGQMMVMVPMAEMPDWLHQQIFRLGGRMY